MSLERVMQNTRQTCVEAEWNLEPEHGVIRKTGDSW